MSIKPHQPTVPLSQSSRAPLSATSTATLNSAGTSNSTATLNSAGTSTLPNPSLETIRTLGVLGAGQMGSGIAQVAAHAHLKVLLVDTQQDVLDRALQNIEYSCNRLIKKQKMEEKEKKDLLENLHCHTQMEAFSQCDFLIEAVTENPKLKLELFQKMDQLAPAHALLCSNTSSISISLLASVTQRPEKVAGMHFMNPVPLMQLVEGIPGLQTSKETFALVEALAEKMGKTFIPSQKDSPGFIVNRILMPMINEAIFALHEGLAKCEDIDKAMVLGTHQPMGPLALADFIGLDTCLAILQVLHRELGEDKYRPCPLLVKYVEADWLGKKKGRGFYTY